MNNTQVALSDAQGPLNQLITNLSGENGQMWLDELNRFLRKEQSWTIPPRWERNIWTRATIGSKKSLEALKASILKRGFNISYSDCVPFDLLSVREQLEFNDSREEIFFATVSARELKLDTNHWTQPELIEAGLKQELAPCLSGDILEILAQPKFSLGKLDNLEGGIHVAMHPIVVHNRVVFSVGKYDGKYHLGYLNGVPTQVYDHHYADNKYIFRVKKRYTF